MAVVESSVALDLQRSSTTSSPRPPRTLSPIAKKPLPAAFQRPFIDPPLQALPSIEGPQQPQAVMKTEGQPSSGTQAVSEFLPVDLLQTLKKQSNSTVSPRGGALSRQPQRHPPLPKSGTPGSALFAKVSPASVWNYSNRRTKLKHLTDAPPCICGAGKDISFLYDADSSKTGPGIKESAVLPGTLIPEDYHLVKHPGVLALEFHEDPYVTQSEDHDDHMTLFPSMRPTGRHEVVALKNTLDCMLKRAGVPNELKDSDLNGPTVMHNLLELVAKEQTIYNICFHELIRQVSVHCMERGELLADIRRRYNNLLDRIPRQVKSVHDELVAQRTLDRKLSTELKRFKGKITSLTNELSSVKDHDILITEQSRTAEDNLTSALADSEKNTSLLAEYHALYELQRKRLEDQVSNLTFERDVWQQASYELTRRVAEECNLQTLKRLQLCEKSWCKLAGHFAVLLSDKDTQQLSEVQGYVQRWKEKVVTVTQGMLSMEYKMKERLEKVANSMEKWSETLTKIISNSKDGSRCPGRSQIEKLFSDIKVWENIINKEAENFTGDFLMDRLEELSSLSSLVEQWTDVSVTLFTRHQADGEDQSVENKRMLEVNAAVELGLKVYRQRISGENGVATGLVHIITPLETWDTKLNIYISTQDKQLPLSDWIKFSTLLKEWIAQMYYIVSCIGIDSHTKSLQEENLGENKEGDVEKESLGENKEGDVEKESLGENKEGDVDKEEGVAPLTEMLGEVEKWRGALSHTIDTSDTLVTAQVCELHSSLVKWMIELLLSLTSTQVQLDPEVAHKQHIVSTADLKRGHAGLVERVTVFTKMLARRSVDVVRDIVDKRIQEDYPNPEEDQIALKRLGNEIEEWVKLSGLLFKKTGSDKEKTDENTLAQEDKREDSTSRGEPEKERDGEDSGSGEEKQIPEELPESMGVVGVDDNIQSKSLQQVIDETEPPPLSSSAELGLATEEVMPEGRPPLREDMEALIVNLDQTKVKLEEQEEKTQQVERRAQTAEKDLEDAKKRISELESELQLAKASSEQRSKSSLKSSRGGSRNSSTKKGLRPSNTLTQGARPISRK